ncbi:50S ribosomal protein L11 methyltransferase [Longispora sp. NPDC051575]|uniref:50S ribosomal protein L11 methyltransferase n=1 Tax=Longispora sp. NPDC051575 TaxID=3154943 RepID=UPI003412233C
MASFRTSPADEAETDRLLASALQTHQAHLAASTAEMTTLLAGLVRGETAIEDVIAVVGGSVLPRWHFEMLNDLERSEAYSVALERRVRPGSLVLDIGSGTGLLALMAARAGAGQVVTCEANPLLAQIARGIIARAGMSHRITVVPKFSTDLVVGVDLPRRADLIVSEIVDCGLVGEGLLPTVAHARDVLLAPGGDLLPARCVLHGTVVSSPALYGLNHVESVAGFDIRLLNLVASRRHVPVRAWDRPFHQLTAPSALLALELLDGKPDDPTATVELTADLDGPAHGLLVWFEMDLGSGVTITNAPDNRSSHWEQAFVPFPSPVRVTAGDQLSVTLCADDLRLSASLSASPANDFVRSAP